MKKIIILIPVFNDWDSFCKLLDEINENIKFINNYEFKSFESAIEFINLVAKKCDELDHHPTWENTYNKIRIELNTLDINGISSLDFELAHYMNKTFKKIKDDK